MQDTTGKIGIARQLANRLYPLTVVIGLLTSLGFPATYLLLQSTALRHAATIRAQNLSERFQGIVVEDPSLWKYQTYKYIRLLQEVAPDKEVMIIRILDEAGRLISGYTYETTDAGAWWNLYAPVGSALITFNNRPIGTVQVGVSRGRLLSVTLSLLLLSTALGISLAVLVYTFPIKVVRETEGQIQNLMETVRQTNAALEARVEERTRELQVAYAHLQEALREAKEASRAKAEFLSNISHELRTPLNAIIGFSELLQQQTPGAFGEREARYLGHIHQAGKHLFRLISTILDFSHVEAGELTLQPGPLLVAETLEDVLVVARGLARKKAQTLETQIEADLPPLLADPLRFKQICFNLLSNAVKFTPERGTITLTAHKASGVSREAESEPRLTPHPSRNFWKFVLPTPASVSRPRTSRVSSGSSSNSRTR